jgi:hypothetical protein
VPVLASRTKEKIPQLTVCAGKEELVLHVREDLLHNSTYNLILDTLQKNMGSGAQKSVRIVTYSFAMFQLMRYCIPSEYVSKIEISSGSAATVPEEDDLRDASGM